VLKNCGSDKRFLWAKFGQWPVLCPPLTWPLIKDNERWVHTLNIEYKLDCHSFHHSTDHSATLSRSLHCSYGYRVDLGPSWSSWVKKKTISKRMNLPLLDRLLPAIRLRGTLLEAGIKMNVRKLSYLYFQFRKIFIKKR